MRFLKLYVIEIHSRSVTCVRLCLYNTGKIMVHFQSCVSFNQQIYECSRIAWPARPINFSKIISCKMGLVPFSVISIEPVALGRGGPYDNWYNSNNQDNSRIANGTSDQQVFDSNRQQSTSLQAIFECYDDTILVGSQHLLVLVS